MAMVSNTNSFLKSQRHQVYCRKKEKDKSQNPQPYKVIEISPPPKNLGIRCLPSVSISFSNQFLLFVFDVMLIGSNAQLID
uniref:Putative ovule protein n=1 Tax=Solanum chacoense TaxID=4108 RepID=A0A0V0GV93_SOLCH